MQSIGFRDSPLAYGRVTRFLHWAIAALLLLQFTGMGLKLMLGRESALASFFVGYHQPTGTILFLLIVTRVLWALANRRNRPAHGDGLVGRAASLGHGLLYVVMLTVPTLALIRAWGSDRGFAPFGFPIFTPKQPAIGWAQGMAEWHGELAWFMAVLILGHVLMVGVHEAMWRDGTMSRMAGAPQREQTFR